jgi:Replication protein C C-terminal region
LRPRTASVVAAIVQKGPAIASPGGYLRELTRKAEAGEFTLGPMLTALIGSRKSGQEMGVGMPEQAATHFIAPADAPSVSSAQRRRTLGRLRLDPGD